MNLLFYMGHPAHFHLFRNAIRILKEQGHSIKIVIKKKDVLEDLVKNTGWNYVNINPRGRRDNRLSIAVNFLMRDWELIRICRKFKPEKLFGTAIEIIHAGKLLGIPSILLNEDDDHVIPAFAWLGFPYADVILCPHCCKIGKWEHRKTGYKGFHELAYLHPKYFQPDPKVGDALKKKASQYFILRFSSLGAHHDRGRTGITDAVAHSLINLLLPHGNVYITTERKIPDALEKFKIKINPSDMHSALYYASIYVGDSQTMAAESAVLGTPSIRFNDFTGQIGYLEELEHEYGLTYGFKTTQQELMFQKINDLLRVADLKRKMEANRQKLLTDCIDLTENLVNFAAGKPSPGFQKPTVS